MKHKKIIWLSAAILPALAILSGCGTKNIPIQVQPGSVTTTPAPATQPSTSTDTTGQTVAPAGGSDAISNEANQIDKDLQTIDDNNFSENSLDDVDQ